MFGFLTDSHCSLRAKSRILSAIGCGLFFTEFVARCHPSYFEDDVWVPGSCACCGVLNIDECRAFG
jgi:hypothetical protein